MVALTTHPTGSRNGTAVLTYSDELYRRFKEALLGSGAPLISDERDVQDFVGRQRKGLERNPREKVGHWLLIPANARVEFTTVEKGDWPITQPGYETTVKCVPPIDPEALKQCVQQFKAEFGLQDERTLVFSEKRREYAAAQGHTSELTQMQSRVAIQSIAGGSDELVKIQIPEPEFAKIRDAIVAPNRPANVPTPG